MMSASLTTRMRSLVGLKSKPKSEPLTGCESVPTTVAAPVPTLIVKSRAAVPVTPRPKSWPVAGRKSIPWSDSPPPRPVTGVATTVPGVLLSKRNRALPAALRATRVAGASRSSSRSRCDSRVVRAAYRRALRRRCRRLRNQDRGKSFCHQVRSMAGFHGGQSGPRPRGTGAERGGRPIGDRGTGDRAGTNTGPGSANRRYGTGAGTPERAGSRAVVRLRQTAHLNRLGWSAGLV